MRAGQRSATLSGPTRALREASFILPRHTSQHDSHEGARLMIAVEYQMVRAIDTVEVHRQHRRITFGEVMKRCIINGAPEYACVTHCPSSRIDRSPKEKGEHMIMARRMTLQRTLSSSDSSFSSSTGATSAAGAASAAAVGAAATTNASGLARYSLA